MYACMPACMRARPHRWNRGMRSAFTACNLCIRMAHTTARWLHIIRYTIHSRLTSDVNSLYWWLIRQRVLFLHQSSLKKLRNYAFLTTKYVTVEWIWNYIGQAWRQHRKQSFGWVYTHGRVSILLFEPSVKFFWLIVWRSCLERMLHNWLRTCCCRWKFVLNNRRAHHCSDRRSVLFDWQLLGEQ